MAFWRVHAKYFDYRGHHYVKGDIIETESDLAVHWPGRFTKLDTPQPPPTAGMAATTFSQSQNPLVGKDVTSRFPLAEQGALRIIHRSDGFHVFEASDTELKDELSLTSLETKSQVNKFIESQMS